MTGFISLCIIVCPNLVARTPVRAAVSDHVNLESLTCIADGKSTNQRRANRVRPIKKISNRYPGLNAQLGLNGYKRRTTSTNK